MSEPPPSTHRDVAAWRRLVLIGGPSRASALERMSTAREAVTRFGSNCAVIVGLGSPFKDAAALSVTALVPVAVAGTQSSSPVTDWWCKAWLLRWVLRVSEVHKRRRVLLAVMRCALRFWRARARGASLFLLRWGQPSRACVQLGTTDEIASVAHWTCGVRLLVPWEAGGVSGRRFLALRDGRAVEWPPRQFIAPLYRCTNLPGEALGRTLCNYMHLQSSHDDPPRSFFRRLRVAPRFAKIDSPSQQPPRSSQLNLIELWKCLA